MHSNKFAVVKRFYDLKMWSKERVHAAVTATPPWITADEYEEIVGEPFVE